MSWEEDGVVGHLGEHGRQAVIELLWVAAGQVRATATLKKQRVAGNESVLYEERLRARCVAWGCLLYTSPSPRDATLSRMPSSA